MDFLPLQQLHNACCNNVQKCWVSNFSSQFYHPLISLSWTPVRARQYVRTYSSWNDGSTWAYTDFKDINLFGNFPTDPLVFFHENSHNLDFWVAGKGTSPYSYTPDWVSTIKKDTCVPDAYSKASNTEDFAQVGVVGIYNANVGNVNTVKSVACMDDQLNRVNGLLYDSYHYVAGQKCDTRLTPT